MQSFGSPLWMLILYLAKASHSQDINCNVPRIAPAPACEEFAQTIHDLNQTSIRLSPVNQTHLINDSMMIRLHWLNPDNCYVLVNVSLNYLEAQDVCRRASGHLVWIGNPKEADNLIHNAIEEGVLERYVIATLHDPLMFKNSEKSQNTSDIKVRRRRDVPPNLSPYKEAIWIGMSIYDNKKFVWDCPETLGHNEPVADLSKYCMENYYLHNDSAGLCQVYNLSSNTMEGCFCPYEKSTNLPFYCETSFPCSVDYYGTCEDFHGNLSLLVPHNETHLLPNVINNGLPSSSCYVLVVDKTDWLTAHNKCIDAGGRLAWLVGESDRGAHTLIDFAKQKNAVDEDAMTAWIGLEHWEIQDNSTNNNNSWWVQQWTCPLGKGRSRRFFNHNPEFNILLEQTNEIPALWNTFYKHPTRDDLSGGHLQNKTYTTSTSPIAFDTYRNKSLPYFCEVIIKESPPPTTQTTEKMVYLETSTTSRTEPIITVSTSSPSRATAHAMKTSDSLPISEPTKPPATRTSQDHHQPSIAPPKQRAASTQGDTEDSVMIGLVAVVAFLVVLATIIIGIILIIRKGRSDKVEGEDDSSASISSSSQLPLKVPSTATASAAAATPSSKQMVSGSEESSVDSLKGGLGSLGSITESAGMSGESSGSSTKISGSSAETSVSSTGTSEFGAQTSGSNAETSKIKFEASVSRAETSGNSPKKSGSSSESSATSPNESVTESL